MKLTHKDVDSHADSASELDDVIAVRERERIEKLKDALVCVNDGQARWVAEQESLIDAMEHLGWSRNGDSWAEPEGYDPSECIDEAPYTRLCEHVEDLSASISQEERDELPEFSWCPSENCWRF